MSVDLNPYLTFEGDAREALGFYQQVFGGELELMTFSDMPGMPSPEGYEDKIMHGVLKAEDVTIMASEAQPGSKLAIGDNVNLSLSGTDNDRLTSFFTGLADGGKITLPLGDQPWGDVFGMLTDKYGVNWLVNISKG